MDNWTSVFETDQLYKAELVNTFGEIYVMVSEEEKGKAEEIIKTVRCE